MSTFDKLKFGQRLKEMRIKAGYARQIDLAEKLGTVVQTISNYESGNRLPDAEMLSRIVEVLPCNADYLLGFEDKPTYSETYITDEFGLFAKSIDALKILRGSQKDAYSEYLIALNLLLSASNINDFLFAFYSYVLGGEECFIAGVDMLTKKHFKIAADSDTLGVFPCDGMTMHFQGFAAGGFKRIIQDANMARMQEYLSGMRNEILSMIDEQTEFHNKNTPERDLQKDSEIQSARLRFGVDLAEEKNNKALDEKRYGKH